MPFTLGVGSHISRREPARPEVWEPFKMLYINYLFSWFPGSHGSLVFE